MAGLFFILNHCYYSVFSVKYNIGNTGLLIINPTMRHCIVVFQQGCPKFRNKISVYFLQYTAGDDSSFIFSLALLLVI